jgi:hypothetical protein
MLAFLEYRKERFILGAEIALRARPTDEEALKDSHYLSVASSTACSFLQAKTLDISTMSRR